MITLYDARSGAVLGTISEDQFQRLSEHLEEEGVDDTDYYVDAPTIDMLVAGGVDAAVIALLRSATAATGDADVRWERG